MFLEGKYALVTGSSRGIGRGIALKLAEKGANVIVHYHKNADAANDTLSKVKNWGSDGFTIQADVSRPEDITRMFRTIADQVGKLDIFVSNARSDISTFYQMPLEISLEQWDIALNSQARALLIGIQEANSLISAGGRIVAMTYAPGSRTGSWQPWAAMGSAKAALESLVRYFAVTLAKRGITVNTISPGLTEDSMFNDLPPETQALLKDWHESGWTPMGRLGTPVDIANAVALLCSEEAGWITGQTIYVDGGASLLDTGCPLSVQQGW